MEVPLELVGFARIVYQPHPLVKSVRGIFEAYDSMPTRGSPELLHFAQSSALKK